MILNSISSKTLMFFIVVENDSILATLAIHFKDGVAINSIMRYYIS